MKQNFTQKELVTLSNGIASLIELIDGTCNIETKQKEHIEELQKLNIKISRMITEK